MRSIKPIAFKWRHFQGELILQCVRWYCKYGISYRDLEDWGSGLQPLLGAPHQFSHLTLLC